MDYYILIGCSVAFMVFIGRKYGVIVPTLMIMSLSAYAYIFRVSPLKLPIRNIADAVIKEESLSAVADCMDPDNLTTLCMDIPDFHFNT
jgi:hypothetical protein